MKKILSFVIMFSMVFSMVGALPSTAFAVPDVSPAQPEGEQEKVKEDKKVKICHQTASNENPWNAIEINESALGAHLEHLQNGTDFYYQEGDGDFSDAWCLNNIPDGTPLDLCENVDEVQTTEPCADADCVANGGVWNEDAQKCDDEPGDPTDTNTATIIGTKIVCPTENLLPNWGDNGANITASTAATFLAANQTCYEEDWTFEWAPQSAVNDVNPGNSEGDLEGWTNFIAGQATVPVGQKIWVREQWDNDYIPFSGDITSPYDTVSAELYCHTDVLHYDNFDWIDPVVAGQTYHCVGFNVPVEPVVDACPDEQTDLGIQNEGPCNSEDVCPEMHGIQTDEADCSNPPLGNSCGLDIALVLDTSGSIILSPNSPATLTNMKSDFNQFVTDLSATPTMFSLTTFASTAQVKQNFTSIPAEIHDKINSISSVGATNWEDGLLKAQSTFALGDENKPNLVIFASDGNPTVNNGSSATGSVTDGNDLTNAISIANTIKAGNILTTGARIITIGIGSGPSQANLEAISSPDAYFSAANFSALKAELDEIITELCGGTLTITKTVNGAPAGAGWEFTIDSDVYTTDSEGKTIAIELTNGSYDVEETGSPFPEYTIDLESASCTGASDNGTPSGNGVSGIVKGTDEIISCVFDNVVPTGCMDPNAVNYNKDALIDDGSCEDGGGNPDPDQADIQVTKTSDAEEEVLGEGDSITYTITVINNGPDTANNVVVLEDLPACLINVVAGIPTQGSFDGSTWIVGTLLDAEFETLTIEATIGDCDSGSLVNTASGGSNENDPNEENNDDDSSVDVNGDGDSNPDGPSSSSSSSGSRRSSPQGQVLGAADEICTWNTQYLRRNWNKNVPNEVQTMQNFLNLEMNSGLTVDNRFGPLTEAAVRAFQMKYRADILTPWGINQPTGIWYLSTTTKAKEIMCGEKTPLPPLINWSQNPALRS